MAKWSNAAVCKTAIRGFDSHSDLINFRLIFALLTGQKNGADSQGRFLVDRGFSQQNAQGLIFYKNIK